MATTSFSAINAALGPSIRNNDYTRYMLTKFNQPVAFTAAAGSGTPAVSDQAINTLQCGDATFQAVTLGAFAGSAPQFIKGAAGLKVVLDAADNDGFELNPGYTSGATLYTAGRGVYTAGTDDMFVRVKFSVTTVANCDFIAVGFRKVEAIQNDLTGYADYFVLNVDNGAIKFLTEVGGGGTSTTDTTQTVSNGGTVTLEVRVSTSRVAKALINGVAPTVDVSGYAFTNALKLVPMLHVQEDATAADPVIEILEWEHGTLAQRGLTGITDLDN